MRLISLGNLITSVMSISRITVLATRSRSFVVNYSSSVSSHDFSSSMGNENILKVLIFYLQSRGVFIRILRCVRDMNTFFFQLKKLLRRENY